MTIPSADPKLMQELMLHHLALATALWEQACPAAGTAARTVWEYNVKAWLARHYADEPHPVPWVVLAVGEALAAYEQDLAKEEN
jgi:hypothetical protein